MWRSPTRMSRNGPPSPSRTPRVESRISAKDAEEPGEEVEEDRLAARRLGVAGDRDADGVERRRGRRFDQALAVLGAWERRSSIRPNWLDEDGGGAAEGDHREAQGRPLRAGPAEARPRPGAASDAGRKPAPAHWHDSGRHPAAGV